MAGTPIPEPVPGWGPSVAHLSQGSMSSIAYTVENNGDTDFDVPFGFISPGHLTVALGGVVQTDWTILDSQSELPRTLRFGSSVTTVAGQSVTISRTTPVATPAAEFLATSTLRLREFKRSRDQVLFRLQELVEGSIVGLSKNLSQTAWDGESTRLTTLLDPAVGTDAVPKLWFDNYLNNELAAVGAGQATGLPDPGLGDTGRMPRFQQDGGTIGVDLPTYTIGSVSPAEVHYSIDMTEEFTAGRSGLKVNSTGSGIASEWPETSDNWKFEVALVEEWSVGSFTNGAYGLSASGYTSGNQRVNLPPGKFQVDAWVTVSTGPRDPERFSLETAREQTVSLGLYPAIDGDSVSYNTELRRAYVGFGLGRDSGTLRGSVTVQTSAQIIVPPIGEDGERTVGLRVAEKSNRESQVHAPYVTIMDGGLHIREILE